MQKQPSLPVQARFLSAPAFPEAPARTQVVLRKKRRRDPAGTARKKRSNQKKRTGRWYEYTSPTGHRQPKRFGRKPGPVGAAKRQMIKEWGLESVERIREAYRQGTNQVSMEEAMHRKFARMQTRRARYPVSINTLDPDKLQSSDYITLSWSSSCWITTELPLLSRAEERDKDSREELPGRPKLHEVEGHGKLSEAEPKAQVLNPQGLSKDTAWLGSGVDIDADTVQEEAEEPSSNPAYFTYRKWAIPRNVRGRDETRQFRSRSRRHMIHFRTLMGQQNKRRLLYYSFRYPQSFFESRGGFLYLYKPPVGFPETAAGLRFRITNDRDPKSFVFGKDLTHNGVPWTIPLVFGAIRNQVIRRLIIKDNLLPSDVIRQCGALRRKAVKLYTHRSRRYKRVHRAWLVRSRPNQFRAYSLHRDIIPYYPLIYAVGQPFSVNFSLPSMSVFFVNKSEAGDDVIQLLKLTMPKRSVRETAPEKREQTISRLVYTGSATLCFQVLTVPQTGGQRVVVLRIMDTTNPVVPDPAAQLPEDVQLPSVEKGLLFPRIDPKTGEAKPWYWPRPQFPPNEPIVQTVMALPEFT